MNTTAIKQLNNLTILILAGIIIGLGIFASYSIITNAQANPDITFPVKELGNCQSATECRAYCENPDNIPACVSFAEKHNLISQEEAAKAKAFMKKKQGPGGCQSPKECEAFCDNPNNLEVCLNFAEENNLMDNDELEEARKVAKAIKKGAQLPGGCRAKKDCDAYCDNPDHIEECIAFAEKADLIPQEELAEAKMAMKAMKSGIKPPGNCRGKKQCETYCNEPSHMEECLAFAETAGFIPPEEAAMARKMMPLMMKGEMPGGCRGKDECEIYCQDESHMEECANFAIKAGLMKPKEAEMFRKTGGKGPGNCKGKEQCEAFCNNPSHQEECFNFAKEHSLIPAEEIEKMKQGMQQMKQGLEMAPEEVKECLKSTAGTEILEKIQAGELTPGPQIGNQIRECFEKFMPQGPRGPQDHMSPPEEMMPPGPEAEKECGPQPPMIMQVGCYQICKDKQWQTLCGKENFLPNREIMKKMMEENPELLKQLPPDLQPSEGFQLPEETNIPEQYRQQFEQQFQQQFQQEYQKQFQQQYEQQYQQQYQQVMPPEGFIPPPSGETSQLPLGSNVFGIFLQLFKGLLY